MERSDISCFGRTYLGEYAKIIAENFGIAYEPRSFTPIKKQDYTDFLDAYIRIPDYQMEIIRYQSIRIY